MTGRSKILAPVVTALAVGAVAVTATVVAGGGHRAHTPRTLRLAGSAASGASAAGSAAGPAAARPASSGGAYRLTGDLPAGKPADAAAWTLPSGAGPASPVARLAEALHAGTPVRDGDGWRAGALTVTGEAGRPWYFSSCVPGTPVAADPAITSGVGCVMSSGQGQAGTATVSPGAVETSPSPGAQPAPPPAQRTPTGDEVRAAAAPLLDAVGLAGAAVRVTVFAGGGSAVVDPALGSLQTSAWTTRIDVDEHGKVTGGNGWLAAPEKSDTYPLVTAREAFDGLPMPPRIMSCEVTPGGGCKEAAPAEVTGAHLGLTVAQLAGGGQVLVPAWLFDVMGSPDPVAGVAVEATYLAPPEQPTGPAVGKPTQAEPATAPPAAGSRGPLSFDSASRATTADAVVVQYGESGSCPRLHVTHAVKEDASRVVVLLEADTLDPKRMCTDDYRARNVTVALQAPLGTRTVVDGTSGREVAVS